MKVIQEILVMMALLVAVLICFGVLIYVGGVATS